VLDFRVADDTIWLDNKYMPKLGKGTAAKPLKLAKAYFALDTAKDTDDHLIYSRKSGVLSYDVDGSGAKAAVAIAVLPKGLNTIGPSDFFII
jgi:serralysin